MECPHCKNKVWRETHDNPVDSFSSISIGCDDCNYAFDICGYEQDRMEEVIRSIFRGRKEADPGVSRFDNRSDLLAHISDILSEREAQVAVVVFSGSRHEHPPTAGTDNQVSPFKRYITEFWKCEDEGMSLRESDRRARKVAYPEEPECVPGEHKNED